MTCIYIWLCQNWNIMAWTLRNMFNEIHAMNSLKYEFYTAKYIYVPEMHNKMPGSFTVTVFRMTDH